MFKNLMWYFERITYTLMLLGNSLRKLKNSRISISWNKDPKNGQVHKGSCSELVNNKVKHYLTKVDVAPIPTISGSPSAFISTRTRSV